MYYEDKDNDGIGIGDATNCLCAPLGAYKPLVAGDCNDADSAMAPGLPEVCDAKDNNCDGNTDPVNSIGCTKYYEDIDMDSYGKTASSKCTCVPTYPFTAGNGGDCNDNQGAIYPGQYEFCNGKDDNCNGQTDADSPDAKMYYMDVDLDGYGGEGRSQCGPDLDYYLSTGGDCNDTNQFISPGRVESCNGKDDNCNGTTDDGGGAALCPTYANAIPSCNTSCSSSCKAGFWDLNSAIGDGCECTTDSTYGISGGSCGGATNLGTVKDVGEQVLRTGNLMPGETGDWYTFTARDEPDDSGCDTFRVAISLVANPSGQYAIDVYRGSCSANSLFCQGETESTWSTGYLGKEPFGPGSLKNPSAVPGPAQPNGPGKHKPSPVPEVGGECPCTVAPGLPGMNLCTDNSAQYYVRVYRVTGIAPTCEDYGLFVSNGVP